MFKSSTQPLCRYCGKPIRKWTTTIYFGKENPENYGSWATGNPAHPETKADAQKHTNQQVVSISYAGEYWWKSNEGRRWIDHATTWDGESYHDEHFCGPKCAERLGYLMARNGRCTTDYNDALTKRTKGKEVA